MALDKKGRLKMRKMANFDGLEEPLPDRPKIVDSAEYHDRKCAIVREWFRSGRWGRFSDGNIGRCARISAADVAKIRKEIEDGHQT